MISFEFIQLYFLVQRLGCEAWSMQVSAINVPSGGKLWLSNAANFRLSYAASFKQFSQTGSKLFTLLNFRLSYAALASFMLFSATNFESLHLCDKLKMILSDLNLRLNLVGLSFLRKRSGHAIVLIIRTETFEAIIKDILNPSKLQTKTE